MAVKVLCDVCGKVCGRGITDTGAQFIDDDVDGFYLSMFIASKHGNPPDLCLECISNTVKKALAKAKKVRKRKAHGK